MSNYRYSLEKYSGTRSRFSCPSCKNRRSFTRYVDNYTKQYVHPTVGRCNHKNKCGYHLKPSVFLNLNPYQNGSPSDKKVVQFPIKPLTPIPESVLNESLRPSSANRFIQYLINLVGKTKALQTVEQYKIGSSSYWNGATIFWFIDINDTIRAGQVKLFSFDGHSIKNKVNWVHKTVQAEPLNNHWVKPYLDNEEKVACLFGEHLLNTDPLMPVALVEAPATAIVASLYFPKYIWLACGSLSYLSRKRCKALYTRSVRLFPDLNGYREWKRKSRVIATLTPVIVDDFLERVASNDERRQGLDLRDYLTRLSVESFLDQ